MATKITHPTVRSIVKALGGNPSDGMCRCPAHEDKTPSLHISEGAGGKLLVKCHAGCAQEAVIGKLREMGLWSSSRSEPNAVPDKRNDEFERYKKFRSAFAILRAAAKAEASPSAYLNARRIEAVPPNAMLLPAQQSRKLIGKGFPAMVLPVTDGERLLGAHVTLLTRDGTKRVKRKDAKKLHGPTRGGYVQFGTLDANKALIIAEGIETALSASQIADVPAIAALNAPNMKLVRVSACSEVIIAADNDVAGMKAAKVLAQRLLDDGHGLVRIAVPDGVNDWNDALTNDAGVADLRKTILQAPRVTDRGIRAIRADRLLSLEFPPAEYLLDPWLEVANLAMIHAARGSGKTWLSLSIAHAIASGEDLLGWTVGAPKRVLYVDGEMGSGNLQRRVSKLGATTPNLYFLAPDQFRARNEGMPDIARAEGQDFLDREIERLDIDVVILDSVSTLVRSGVENEAESWLPIQTWALRHRWRGRTVILIHHDNRVGRPRGSSKREDVLNAMIGLKERKDLVKGDESAFELTFTKSREFYGDDAKPRIIRLSMESGAVEWSSEQVKDRRTLVREMMEKGFKQSQIAVELGITASAVSQIKSKL